MGGYIVAIQFLTHLFLCFEKIYISKKKKNLKISWYKGKIERNSEFNDKLRANRTNQKPRIKLKKVCRLNVAFEILTMKKSINRVV